MEITYDDTNLQRLFAEMEPKRRVQALKGAFRKEANAMRKAAVANLRQSIRSDKDLEKGVRALVFKRKAGFRVTVGTKAASKKTGKGEAGFHTNRRGLKKPVLIWAELGTKKRSTKTRTRISTRKRRGHNTGQMDSYAFIGKARDQMAPTATENIHRAFRENVQRIAKKYGCK